MSMESTSTPRPGAPTHDRCSPAHTPTHSTMGDWSSCNLGQSPSSILSNGSNHTETPNGNLEHAGLHAGITDENSAQSHLSSSKKSFQWRGHNWITREADLPRPNLEPKNLLSLFEETTPWVHDCQFTFKGMFVSLYIVGWGCPNVCVQSLHLSLYELLWLFCDSHAAASCI